MKRKKMWVVNVLFIFVIFRYGKIALERERKEWSNEKWFGFFK